MQMLIFLFLICFSGSQQKIFCPLTNRGEPGETREVSPDQPQVSVNSWQNVLHNFCGQWIVGATCRKYERSNDDALAGVSVQKKYFSVQPRDQKNCFAHWLVFWSCCNLFSLYQGSVFQYVRNLRFILRGECEMLCNLLGSVYCFYL